MHPAHPFSHFRPAFFFAGYARILVAKTVASKLHSFLHLHFPILIFPSFICIRFSISRISSPSHSLSLAAILFSVESDKSNYTFKLRYAVLSPFFRRLFYTSLPTVPVPFSFLFSSFCRSFAGCLPLFFSPSLSTQFFTVYPRSSSFYHSSWNNYRERPSHRANILLSACLFSESVMSIFFIRIFALAFISFTILVYQNFSSYLVVL